MDGADLSGADLLAIQIDGIHIDDGLILVAAIGIDAKATNIRWPRRGRDREHGDRPGAHRQSHRAWARPDGAEALHHRWREGPVESDPGELRTEVAIQRCQVHKARNIMDRLPKSFMPRSGACLRQAWELDDADKAEQLIRNLARRLERERPGVAALILEGLDEILTVIRLKLPKELRRSLACTNIVENMMGTVRRVCRNVKRWRSAWMALRWAAAAMKEAAKGFRRLKATSNSPRYVPLSKHTRTKTHTASLLAKPTPLNINLGSDRFAMFNKVRDIPTPCMA